MKKLLLSVAVALMGLAASAQAPDASQWQVGDEVSEAVGFGNLSFNSNPMDYWTVETTKGNPNTTGGVFEIYDGTSDVFQYLYLPAGMYEVNCQGYYRYGTSWDVDPNRYADGTWKNLSEIYASVGTYDIDSKEFTESGSNFSNPLMPRLFEGVTEQLYVGPKKGEEGWAGWDMSDGQYSQVNSVWGPTSIPGSLVWFAADKYRPFESTEDETVYNKVIFFVTEDSWVRVGVRKTGEQSADSYMATNFHLIYKGTADDAAKIALAMKALEVAQRNAEELADRILTDYPALGSMLQDEVMDCDYDGTSVEGVDAGTAAFKDILTRYTKYYSEAKSLTAAIQAMEELANATDYSGKDAFLIAIEAATKVATAEELTDIDGPEAYAAAYNELNEARGVYVLTRPSVDNVYNYSDLINQPFFCNNEFNPVWNEENGQYMFNDEIESTWATVQEKGYSEQLADAASATWIPICSNVTIATSGSDEGRWVIHSTTWHGGGPLGVTIQHSYPAIGGWTAEPSGNPELLHQTITNLPNGFYSMSALMCNAGADVSPLQYVYIQNAEGAEAKAQLTQKGSPWWGGNKNQWRSTVWEKLSTGMIQVSDGKVTIGSSSDAFYAVTGFQLYYYGEAPDFMAMIQKSLDAVNDKAAENLTFPGDLTRFNELMAAVPATIQDYDAFEAANKAIEEANLYVDSAFNYINNWHLDQNIIDAQANYDVDAPEYMILNKMFDEVQLIGSRETDTYKTARTASELFNALNNYFNYRKTVAEYAVYYDKIPEIIAAQNTGLLAAVTTELIAEYTEELQAAEKIGVAADIRKILEPLGIENATLENAIDITAIVQNPKYDEGSKGWDGAITVDANLHNAERYNTKFNVSQTIKSLPAGCYKVVVQSFYRDGGSAGNTTSGVYYNWNVAAAEDTAFWTNRNVELYTSTSNGEKVSYIQSLAAVKYETPSTDRILDRLDETNVEQVIDPITEEPLKDENGNPIWTAPDTIWYTYKDSIITWQLDQRVYIVDEETSDTTAVYYYPNSMTGANARFNKSPEAYLNEVYAWVEEGGALTFGIRKDKEISNDWCIFDNWKLFYLGTEPPTAIAEVNVNKPAMTGIYNLSGQQMKNAQKGLNIIDGKKVFIK